MVALDELREDIYNHPCNKREDKKVIAAKYPMLNVDGLTDIDEWYGAPFPEERFERLNCAGARNPWKVVSLQERARCARPC